MPEVGADLNMWGTHLNSDISTIDTHMLSRALTTSQTIAGPITFSNNPTISNTLPQLTFNETDGVTYTLNAASGYFGIRDPDTAGAWLVYTDSTGAFNFAKSITTTGNVSVGGTLTVSAKATFNNAVDINGVASLYGNTQIGNAGATRTLVVTGATTLQSTLLAGDTTLNSLTVTNGGTFGSNGLNVGSGQLRVLGGNVSMSGGLTVTGDTLVTGGNGVTVKNANPLLYIWDTTKTGETAKYYINVDGNSDVIGFRGPVFSGSPNWLMYVDKYGNFNTSGKISANGSVSATTNISLGGATTNGNCVITIANGTPPTVGIANVGQLFVMGGSLYYLGASGIPRRIADA